MSFGRVNQARERFDEIEAAAAVRNEQALLEHRDELPKRSSVLRRALDQWRRMLTGQRRA